jgi:hypothetical protein
MKADIVPILQTVNMQSPSSLERGDLEFMLKTIKQQFGIESIISGTTSVGIVDRNKLITKYKNDNKLLWQEFEKIVHIYPFMAHILYEYNTGYIEWEDDRLIMQSEVAENLCEYLEDFNTVDYCSALINKMRQHINDPEAEEARKKFNEQLENAANSLKMTDRIHQMNASYADRLCDARVKENPSQRYDVAKIEMDHIQKQLGESPDKVVAYFYATLDSESVVYEGSHTEVVFITSTAIIKPLMWPQIEGERDYLGEPDYAAPTFNQSKMDPHLSPQASSRGCSSLCIAVTIQALKNNARELKQSCRVFPMIDNLGQVSKFFLPSAAILFFAESSRYLDYIHQVLVTNTDMVTIEIPKKDGNLTLSYPSILFSLNEVLKHPMATDEQKASATMHVQNLPTFRRAWVQQFARMCKTRRLLDDEGGRNRVLLRTRKVYSAIVTTVNKLTALPFYEDRTGVLSNSSQGVFSAYSHIAAPNPNSDLCDVAFNEKLPFVP